MKDLKTQSKSEFQQKLEKDQITRKEAMIKAGKYAAFTAAVSLMILSPKQSQAGSTPASPGW